MVKVGVNQVDTSIRQEQSFISELARRLHLREAGAAGAVLLAAAGCACSPDQQTLEAPGTSAKEMTTGTVGTTVSPDELPTPITPAPTTTTSEIPSTVPEIIEPTTTEVEHTRPEGKVDIYGMGPLTMGMSRQDINNLGLEISPSCGQFESVNLGPNGTVTVDFDETDHVNELAIYEDSTLQTLSGAKIGSYADELTKGYYKEAYDNGTLVYQSLPNNGMAYELTAYEETGHDLWFIIYNGQVKGMDLLPVGQQPTEC